MSSAVTGQEIFENPQSCPSAFLRMELGGYDSPFLDGADEFIAIMGSGEDNFVLGFRRYMIRVDEIKFFIALAVRERAGRVDGFSGRSSRCAGWRGRW